MIKRTEVWELSSTTDHKHNIYVRSFSVSKARSLKDYVKTCVRDEQPDHIIVHVETNNLNSENNPGRAPETIVNFVEGIVSDKRKVADSGIIPKNDK